jgi:hypothetical protein
MRVAGTGWKARVTICVLSGWSVVVMMPEAICGAPNVRHAILSSGQINIWLCS